LNKIKIIFLSFFFMTFRAFSAPALLEQNVDNIVSTTMQENHLPGLALAVIKNGQSLIIKGYGNATMGPNQPVDGQTLFAIGSVSKVLTGFALMTLIEQGKVGLDDSILKYLPDAPSQWQAVTIRELFSHTSGIPQHQGPHLPWQKTWTIMAKKPMQFAPGTDYKYNNFGFVLLGRVIEVVSGQDLATFLQNTVYQPLGMSQTGFPDNLNPPGLAVGYHFQNGQFSMAPNVKPWQQMGGSGGIVSTAADLAKWDMAMSAGKILSPKTYALMWTPVFLANGQPSGKNGLSWSLGWQVSYRGNKLVAQKDGAIRGYSSFMIRHIDDQITIILLTNTNKAHLRKLAHQIFLAVKGKKAIMPTEN
jgi:CubicO group peptidase (beta-lactamase class C family)